MIGIIFALLAALVHAISAVMIRNKIDESDFVSVALVTSIIGNIVLWPLAFLFTNYGAISLNAILFFALKLPWPMTQRVQKMIHILANYFSTCNSSESL